MDLSHIPTPLLEGTLVLEKVQEGQEPHCRTITFTPPLKVEYTIWPDEDEKADKTKPTVAYFTFDFGMTSEVGLTSERNCLTWGYEGLTKESNPEEILIKTLTFDLFHAFCHCEMDPNYTSYHWALAGWLKDRVTVKDDED